MGLCSYIGGRRYVGENAFLAGKCFLYTWGACCLVGGTLAGMGEFGRGCLQPNFLELLLSSCLLYDI